MAIITLTTDFGEKDHFAGSIKGAIYTEQPDVRIVDISHSVSPFNIPEAAYIIKNAYASFPKGSIHIIGIDSELTPDNKHIAMKLDDHYFICADNGILSMITTSIMPEKIVEINIHDQVDTSFPVLDVFVKVACHLARGGTLEVIGKPIDQIKQLTYLKPYVNEEQSQVIGSIMYVDNYGNIVTNITKSFFESIAKGREFEISARHNKFKKLATKYSDVVDFSLDENKRNADGKGLVIFNSSNYLEIAIYKSNRNTVGTASSLMGLHFRDTVTVNFIKPEPPTFQ